MYNREYARIQRPHHRNVPRIRNELVGPKNRQRKRSVEAGLLGAGEKGLEEAQTEENLTSVQRGCILDI